MFGHGPATPTLANVYMLTGLDISTVDEGSIYGRRAEHRVNTRNIGGWTGYIQEYQRTGTVNQREHTIFLNMWLEKFIFCDRSVGPTNAFLPTAELLANGVRFPLGRYLLSSTYHLLHQVSQKLLLDEPIGNLGGSWWLINMWLNAICTNVYSGFSSPKNSHEKSLKIMFLGMRNRQHAPLSTSVKP
jgi:hypothetical protein